jgi:DNA mismatch endonuclease (patch repair protein)
MMAGIQGKNTRPELFLRKALHAMGFRYRLGGKGLPGKPDIIFPKKRVVIFVHGCFWHMHECKYFKWPATNPQFWREKLDGNVQRDRRVTGELQSKGWTVLTVWECELKESKYQMPNSAVLAIAAKLKTLT